MSTTGCRQRVGVGQVGVRLTSLTLGAGPSAPGPARLDPWSRAGARLTGAARRSAALVERVLAHPGGRGDLGHRLPSAGLPLGHQPLHRSHRVGRARRPGRRPRRRPRASPHRGRRRPPSRASSAEAAPAYLLVGLGQLPADRGPAVRARRRSASGGQGVRRAVRRLEEDHRPRLARPARPAAGSARRPCGAGTPRSRTGPPAVRRRPARSAPPTGPGTAVTADAVLDAAATSR